MNPALMHAMIPPRANAKVATEFKLAAPFCKSILLAYAINASVIASFQVIHTYDVIIQNIMKYFPN